jgi:hypothetical protein
MTAEYEAYVRCITTLTVFAVAEALGRRPHEREKELIVGMLCLRLADRSSGAKH